MGNDPDGLARDLQDQFASAHLIGDDAEFEQLVARVVGFVEEPKVARNGRIHDRHITLTPPPKARLLDRQATSKFMKHTLLSCRLALPANFCHAHVLDFHRHDALMVAEHVDNDVLHKGLAWGGRPD